MKFNLWQLLCLVTAITLLMIAIDRGSRSTVHVRILSVRRLNDSLTAVSNANPKDVNFLLHFEYKDARFQTGSLGAAEGKYGFDQFAVKHLDSNNLEDLIGVEIDITYRYRSIAWSPLNDWKAKLNNQYTGVQVLPQVEELADSQEKNLHKDSLKCIEKLIKLENQLSEVRKRMQQERNLHKDQFRIVKKMIKLEDQILELLKRMLQRKTTSLQRS